MAVTEKKLVTQLEAFIPLKKDSFTLPEDKKIGLVIVDEVSGFVSVNGGAMAPKAVDPKIAKMVQETVQLAQTFANKDWPILAFLSAYAADKPQAPYPPHCVVGSGEENLVPELRWLEKQKGATIVKKDCVNGYIGAAKPDGSNTFVKWTIVNRLDSILVVGMCTDLAVMELVLTVVSARNHGLLGPLKDVHVYTEGCATYSMTQERVKSLGLNNSAIHPQELTNYLGLYFMAARGAHLIRSIDKMALAGDVEKAAAPAANKSSTASPTPQKNGETKITAKADSQPEEPPKVAAPAKEKKTMKDTVTKAEKSAASNAPAVSNSNTTKTATATSNASASTNANTNANANTNRNTDANANTNANANRNTGTNANTNANANRNTGTNANTNANANTSVSVNATANKKKLLVNKRPFSPRETPTLVSKGPLPALKKRVITPLLLSALSPEAVANLDLVDARGLVTGIGGTIPGSIGGRIGGGMSAGIAGTITGGIGGTVAGGIATVGGGLVPLSAPPPLLVQPAYIASSALLPQSISAPQTAATPAPSGLHQQILLQQRLRKQEERQMQEQQKLDGLQYQAAARVAQLPVTRAAQAAHLRQRQDSLLQQQESIMQQEALLHQRESMLQRDSMLQQRDSFLQREALIQRESLLKQPTIGVQAMLVPASSIRPQHLVAQPPLLQMPPPSNIQVQQQRSKNPASNNVYAMRRR
ncbi:hypothetical protein CBR_g51381 [Chara braunii]|uniref:Isochorismatase-like domain-containing protein n=1 Tax=Chara braunii TaxID=69332 RepID=A0A388M8N9_CHABU|nr:hypothetical protein CBR_g51381 [Chara braunii]|eukprot:GBG90875.1 hypothetical protein CBR_g51381 [Chara braunii]